MFSFFLNEFLVKFDFRRQFWNQLIKMISENTPYMINVMDF